MLTQLREATFGRFVRLVEQKKHKLPIPQPKKYNEKRGSFLRKLATETAGYAESGHTFDPSGRYLCGTCNQRSTDKGGRSPCATVSGNVSLATGGCTLYHIGPALGARFDLPQKASQSEAGYGERPKAKGFGCSRCKYSEKAVAADSAGRPSWCGYWGMHVNPKACCFWEDGPDLIAAPGDKNG